MTENRISALHFLRAFLNLLQSLKRNVCAAQDFVANKSFGGSILVRR